MGQAYPNPFVDKITVPVMIADDRTSAELQIFDMLGRPVKTTHQFFEKKGLHKMEWNNQNEKELDAGMLFYRVKLNDQLTPMRRIIKTN